MQTTPISPAIRALFLFLSQNYEGLQNAALVLGGGMALRRVQHLLDHLSSTHDLTRRARHDLIALRELFTLEYVGDPERLETALFAEIDPTDPMVEDICWLTDQLEDHMRAIDAASDLPVFELGMAA
ncbi:hypothetical protein DS909_22160 [Phaeobacter gallaeciensis]|uniref:Uncharacterized protein n=1 Tax=Phaeobacter gallaeciensis TaxID=60890 RepID=A0A366WLS4_9RHOB|nr:hypothetical protein [Phaeobacter gallaeciensis]RBW49599.1 hypothetical protein DS909_22160 [Phaeobacter gallaeciensis]